MSTRAQSGTANPTPDADAAKTAEAAASGQPAARIPRGEALALEMQSIARHARKASRALATASPAIKNAALAAMAAALRDREGQILDANNLDLANAREAGLSAAMIDRLDLGRGRVEKMAEGIEQVARLDDPVGAIEEMTTRPNGLRLGKMRAPIGVIGIIYESRPNVTADAACLCVKSGNAVILRGGSEAFHSNQTIALMLAEAATAAGLPEGAIQFVPTTDRAAVNELLKLDEDIDVIIPRGGRQLIEAIVENSKIPVIKHLDGNCFIYVDESADVDEAVEIVVNAKTQRPGVCNALESLLVHEGVAGRLYPKLIPALLERGVEIRADASVRPHAGDLASRLVPVREEDWETEYLDLILTAGTVPSMAEAVEFINAHSSHHTDAILTRDHDNAMRFLAAVDSACVFVNCSTRFSDGGEFGLGCEIGISTNKLHARGPMGLRELTTLKWIVLGEGQVKN